MAKPILPIGRCKNLTGKSFGYWTAVGFLGRINGKTWWLFRCVCGTERRVCYQSFLASKGRSCGCKKGELISLAKRRERVTVTHKQCSLCKDDLLASEFGGNPRSPDGLTARCRPCRNLRLKDIRAINETVAEQERAASRRWKAKESVRDKVIRAKYGIGIDDYRTMKAAQGGACAICGQHQRGEFSLCVDHCHRTGKVRGLLCRKCNAAIGYLGDTVDGVLKALRYLWER